MPGGGLEPPWVAPYAPQTYVSTNSTIRASSEGCFLPVKNEKYYRGEGKDDGQHKAYTSEKFLSLFLHFEQCR